MNSAATHTNSVTIASVVTAMGKAKLRRLLAVPPYASMTASPRRSSPVLPIVGPPSIANSRTPDSGSGPVGDHRPSKGCLPMLSRD
jgi:hypothetical protein